MSDFTDATGAGDPLGRVAPLTLLEWSRYEAWMQQLPFERLQSPAVRSLPESLQAMLASKAAEESSTYFYGHPNFSAMLQSFKGIARVWAEMRRLVVPSMTVDKAAAEITVENYEETRDLVLDLNGFKKREKPKDGEQANPEA